MTYDWIVIGNGLAGAALSYELQKTGFTVLLLDSATLNSAIPNSATPNSATPNNASHNSATRYSYGGIAYWAGRTQLMQQLGQEGLDRYRTLSAELEAEIHFRETNLLLTIAIDRDPATVAASYASVAIPPTLLTVEAACAQEPLLNPAAISGALLAQHGVVSPQALVAAYNQAFLRLGGNLQLAAVHGWLNSGNSIQGVRTSTADYHANQIAVCAGAMTRSLLQAAGLSTQLYFSQAELIETEPIEIKLRSLVMPAELQRFVLEATATTPALVPEWEKPQQQILPEILDAGVVQLPDRRLRIGQISRLLTDLNTPVDAAASEQALRTAIGQILPTLKSVPGRWCSCGVAFSGDQLPLIGSVGETQVYLFTGFSNPFAILPPLARRFAQAASGASDSILPQLSPNRFG